MEKDVLKSNKDQNSGLLIRKGTRTLTEDEIKISAGTREFVDVMSIDNHNTRFKNSMNNQTHGFFTNGVVTDVSTTISSK
jgi:F0F1-type ATP synthase epsilon subunit